MSDLAIQGGRPVRNTLLPYGHQSIDEEDIQAVVSHEDSGHCSSTNGLFAATRQGPC